MRSTDRWVGFALALLALAVIQSARSFPAVPGQKLGAAFLPMLVGAGLLVCGVVLVLRSLRSRGNTGASESAAAQRGAEHYGSAAVIVGAVIAYITLSERIGFLFIAPLCLVAVFLALRVRPLPALLWAVAGTLVVHLAFYKLLRVPLPWGVLRPLY